MTLKLEHISKTFGEGLAKTKVLKDINLDVQPGEFIILNGASGSGKSTLLNILGGLLTPTDGKILYEGHDLYSNYKNSTELRLNDIGFIFQSSHLVPYLTVEEQLTVIAKEAGVNKKEAVSNVNRNWSQRSFGCISTYVIRRRKATCSNYACLYK